ncbi:unnamed protein product [Caenorhabditis auriculariae]|uniref:DUF19 domain-containing protein n=1 Tax=Caenorhabditis auriculariae TaxID=2777116 RepID=A0A8S1H7G8_9PELO|nr:unnamed protein product [Caenorhabditis auriculariae]
MRRFSLSCFFLFVFIHFGSSSKTSRARRSHDDDDSGIIDTPPCDVICEAQWKSEFQMNFGKLYDTQYFEVPLDTVVMRNLDSLKTFCSSTQQKYACFKRECDIHRFRWSPAKHICIAQLAEFEKNNQCLSKTDRFVQRECTEVCDNLEIRVSPLETTKLVSLGVSSNERTAYIDQNEHCYLIVCHQMCHEHVISKVCGEKAADARSLVKNYYDAYLQREYNALLKEGHEKLYSSFCRRVTPHQHENAVTPNMTRWNNRSLDRMRSEIKKVLANITLSVG